MNLFTYGTLMFPEVLEAVSGKSYGSVESLLKGYRRVLVRGRPYPGIYACQGHDTTGRLYSGLDESLLVLLDRFEGSLYERRRVTVQAPGRSSVDATVYVIADNSMHMLSSEPWIAERFLAEWFDPYVQTCHEFRRRHQDRTSDTW